MIGISIGDITGIGPEVTLKALAAESGAERTDYLLIGDVEHALALNQKLGLGLRLEECGAAVVAGFSRTRTRTRTRKRTRERTRRSGGGQILVVNPMAEKLPANLRVGAAEAARAAVAWLKDGARRCLRGELDALVTAPVNKEAIIRAGLPFTGQTELLSGIARAKRTAMMLLGHDDRNRWLRVALVTTHVPLKRVSQVLTRPKIELAIALAARACRDLRLPRARVAVCGLNPHAGEGGAIGDEEQKIIGPAVKAAQGRGLDVTGPMSADALFYYAFKGDYDAVVAMYHDQGLAPLKMIGFETGVNWTLGLPFVRTSPDHGTAYDIAGRGKANPSSMMAAIGLAKQLVQTNASLGGLHPRR